MDETNGATVRKRLVSAMRLRGLTSYALDVAIGKTRYCAYVVNGRCECPGIAMIELLARALRVEPAWLAFGAGPICAVDDTANAA